MSNMHRVVVAGIVGLLAFSAWAVPKPGYYHPSVVQVGTTTRVIMGGDLVGGVQGAWITGEGARVKRIVPVPGFPRAAGRSERPFVRNWLYDILEGKTKKGETRKLPPEATVAETDWQECGWWFHLEELTELELQMVARDLYTPEDYPQATPALNHLLILDVEVDADAKPGRRDIFLYDRGSASAPHPFFITKEPNVDEPFFVFPPRNNRLRVPHVLHIPPDIKPQPIPVHLNGQIWPGEVDTYTLRLEEGQQLVCSVLARELFPYLGDAVPGFFNAALHLYDATGREVAFADDFYYLPDPVLTYKVPQDGFYVLKIHDNLYRGGPNFAYSIFCRDVKTDRPIYSPRDRAFACYPQPAAFIPPKPGKNKNIVIRKGTIDMPGRVDRHTFTLKEPGEWHFELYARREGSPLDGVMQLYGPMGDLPLSVAPLLATWDDNPGRLYIKKNVGNDDLPIIKKFMLYEGCIPQAESDPSGTFTIKEPGKYCVTVADQPGLGGEHYDYTLAISPAEPSFEVFALQSTCLVRGGNASFTACVLRKDGFTGDIVFNSTDLYDISGEFTGDALETEVSISFKTNWVALKRVNITASGDLPNGKTLTVNVTPTDPAEQAFAYSHLLPAQGFYFGIAGESVREKFKYPGPELSGVKEKHSGGRACTSCHEKNARKAHSKGKTCNECHTNKE